MSKRVGNHQHSWFQKNTTEIKQHRENVIFTCTFTGITTIIPWTSTYVKRLDMINATIQRAPKMKAKPECCKCLAVSDLSGRRNQTLLTIKIRRQRHSRYDRTTLIAFAYRQSIPTWRWRLSTGTWNNTRRTWSTPCLTRASRSTRTVICSTPASRWTGTDCSPIPIRLSGTLCSKKTTLLKRKKKEKRSSCWIQIRKKYFYEYI